MNKEKCERTMNSFLELDKNERMPLSMTAHLLRCRSCRRQVHYLTLAEKIAAHPLKIASPLSDEKINSIMKEADPSWSEKFLRKNPVSMVRWVVCGILMVLFLMCFGFVSKYVNSEVLQVSFYLVFAIFIVCYSAIFVGSNLDFFVKKIDTLRSDS